MTLDWSSHHHDHFKGKRVLVTGGAGFIGSHLIEALIQLGAQVVALDNLCNGSWDKLEGFDQSVTKITVDILDPQALVQATEGVEYVFHQAALGSVPKSVEEPRLYHEVCVMGTLNVLEAARIHKVKRVVYAGSSSAYGDPPGVDLKVEDLPGLPKSPYAVGKLAGEMQMRAWSESYGVDTAITRYFNIFGPRQAADSAYAAVIAAFAKAMYTGGQTRIYGDGTQSRDFTFVANAVHANLLAARHPEWIGGEVFNTATGEKITVNQLHDAMKILTGRTDLEPEYLEVRAGDVMHSQANITKAQKILDYQTLVSFEDGLAETVAWYKGEFVAST